MNFLSKLLILHLICHYAVQLLTAIFINPQEMISVGLHERIGDCNEMVPVETVLKVHVDQFVFLTREVTWWRWQSTEMCWNENTPPSDQLSILSYLLLCDLITKKFFVEFVDTPKTKIFMRNRLWWKVLRLPLFTESETSIGQQCVVHDMWNWIWVSLNSMEKQI